jgi:hypothetical protein
MCIVGFDGENNRKERAWKTEGGWHPRDSFDITYTQVEGSCECGNELLGLYLCHPIVIHK